MKKNNLRNRIYQICYETNNPHLASSLSCLNIIKEIYSSFDFKNDVFILSKGHGCPALYAVLESYGFKPDVSKSHPDIDIENGISCTTGSLGHGLPIGVGMALAKKVQGQPGKIYVLLGDMECLEGTTWESLNLAWEYDLDNLIVHIDNNEKVSYLPDVIIHKTKKEYPHVYRMNKEEYEKNIL